MKYLLALSISFCSFFLNAQEKGLTPVPFDSAQGTGQTYAVVVGISDYQDDGIPDLRFADKDAEAFAAFLQSPAGGSLDEDHLKVLLNEKATMAQFAIALDWLMEVAKENDRVIIYFSGHGDVEKKTLTQPGFLLCWDAPAKVYLAGGTLALPMFQEVISTLSIQNKAKVVVITDACRSGKLSGSKVGGSQLTSSNLAKQYANEIKILSCQPDEYSIEGEQWGGGRGAFSYHLLDGLTGMADGNADNTVNLKEIGRYLEDYVTEEVAPQSQNPMVIGNKTEQLTEVFPELLAQLKAGKKGQLQLFTSTELRGIEDEVLAAADSNIVEMYLAFQKSLSEKNFLSDSSDVCADFYYEKLSKEPQLEKLHSSMRRNYAAALQDDAQQVINKLLNSLPLEVNKTLYAKNKNYGNYPRLLRRAAKLLEEQHYMYPTLMARSYWFEGYLEDASCNCPDQSNAKKVLPYYRKALHYQPEMPHAWLQMALVYGIQLGRRDSMEYYANLAVDAVPGWVGAYYWAGYSYNTLFWNSEDSEDIENGKDWLEKGLLIDTNSVLLLSELGDTYAITGEFKKAEKHFLHAMEITPNAQTLQYLGWCYFDMGNFQKAEKAWVKAVELDSTYMTKLVNVFGNLYGQTNREEEIDAFWNSLTAKFKPTAPMYKSFAQGYFQYFPDKALPKVKESISLDSSSASALNLLAVTHSYMENGDEQEELEYTRKAFKLASDNPVYANNIALVYLRQNNIDSTEKYNNIALENDPDYVFAYGTLSMLYFQNGMLEKAKKQLRIGMDRNEKSLLKDLAYCARRYIMNPDLTTDYFRFIEKIYPNNPLVNVAIAEDYILFKKDKESAFNELEKSIQKGLTEKDRLIYGHFIPLKLERRRWNNLVRERFPGLVIED